MNASTLCGPGPHEISLPPMAGSTGSATAASSGSAAAIASVCCCATAAACCCGPPITATPPCCRASLPSCRRAHGCCAFMAPSRACLTRMRARCRRRVASRHVALVALADRPDGLPELCAEARYSVDEDLDDSEVDQANWNCRPIGVRHLEDLDVVKPKFTMRRMRCGTKRNWNGSSSVLHHLCALCVIGTAARGALGSCVLEIGRRQPMVTSTPRLHEPEAVLEPARRCLGRVTGRADVQPARRPRREWRRVRKRSPQRAVWHRFRDDPREHPLLSDRAAGRCQGRPWHS